MKTTDGEIFTTDTVSKNIERTPEGYLLCKGVTISRVGTFDYLPHEVPDVVPTSGMVRITRTKDELFSDTTVRSFEGKPVVIGHDEFATPQNWADVSVGVVMNVRAGDDDKSLVADLLITKDQGIELVESGRLREVSCGYDANVIDDGNGAGHQEGIVGNHLALVDKARCGASCKIMDGAMNNKIIGRLRAAFDSQNKDDFETLLGTLEVGEGDATEDGEPDDEFFAQNGTDPETNPALEEDLKRETNEDAEPDGTGHDDIAAKIASLEARLAKLEGQHTDEDPEPETEEPADPDAEPVPDDEAKEIMQDAEECCPGIKKPVADSASGKISRGALKRVMRQCIKNANRPLFGDGSQLDGQALTIAFKAVAQLERSARNPRAKQADSKPADLGINERNAAFWKGR